MKNGNAWVEHWRQLTVDSFIGAATLLIAAAAAVRASDVSLMILIATALLGAAWLLERAGDAQRVADLWRALRSPEVEPSAAENIHGSIIDPAGA